MIPVRLVFSLVLVLVLAGCVQVTPDGDPDASAKESPSPDPDRDDRDETFWVPRETKGDWGKTEWTFLAADWYEPGGGCPDGESLRPFELDNPQEDVLVLFPTEGCWIEGRIHLEQDASKMHPRMHFPANANNTESGQFVTYLDGRRLGGMGGGGPGNWVGLVFQMDLAAGNHTLRIVSEQEPGDVAFFDRVVITPASDPILVIDESDF